jgi:hypothetical protein
VCERWLSGIYAKYVKYNYTEVGDDWTASRYAHAAIGKKVINEGE